MSKQRRTKAHLTTHGMTERESGCDRKYATTDSLQGKHSRLRETKTVSANARQTDVKHTQNDNDR